MSDVVNAEKLTETYLKIRDKRSKMSAEFKEKDKALTAQMDKVKRALLDYCAEHGLDSVTGQLRLGTGRAIGNLCTSLF